MLPPSDLDEFFPRASGEATAYHACMFTNSPDDHFVVDLLDSLDSGTRICWRPGTFLPSFLAWALPLPLLLTRFAACGATNCLGGGHVVVAGGFSGHGFKFCSVIGEILADLAERGETGKGKPLVVSFL